MSDVLVVDDGLEMQDWMGWLLRREAVPFRLAQDGPQALRLANVRWPGVVLLDLRLAGALDGWQVWDRLLARCNGQSLRVIVMAGALSVADQEQAHKRAAWAILPKPVSRERLVRCLCEALAEADAYG